MKSWSPISGPAFERGKFCVLPSSLFFPHLNGWRYREDMLETREGPAKKKKQRSGQGAPPHARPYASHLSPRRLLSSTLRQCILHNGKGSIRMQPRLVALLPLSAKLHSDFLPSLLAPRYSHSCWAASDAALASKKVDVWTGGPIQACWGCMPKLAANVLRSSMSLHCLHGRSGRLAVLKEALWSLNFTIIS